VRRTATTLTLIRLFDNDRRRPLSPATTITTTIATTTITPGSARTNIPSAPSRYQQQQQFHSRLHFGSCHVKTNHFRQRQLSPHGPRGTTESRHRLNLCAPFFHISVAVIAGSIDTKSDVEISSSTTTSRIRLP
jgi:hypothetical protein